MMAKPTPELKSPSPSVSFNFNEQLKAPANFKELNIAEKVKLIVTGRVKSISQGKNYDNKTYQDLSVEIDSVDLEIGGPKNLKEAYRVAQSKAEKLNK